MATIIHGSTDDVVQRLKTALDAYEEEHPGATAELYRQNPGSVRIRIIDRHFEGMGRSRRDEVVGAYLTQQVGEDILSEVSLLLLLPQSELSHSLTNLEFENPRLSQL